MRPRLQQHLHEFRAGLQEVLAVIQNNQESPIPEYVDQRLDQGTTRFLLDAEHGRHRLRHEPRVGDRRQLDEPHAVREFVHEIGGDLQRQARLADAAGAHQRQQWRAGQQRRDFGLLTLAADERRQLLRQVVGRRLQRAQRRKGRPKPGVQ